MVTEVWDTGDGGDVGGAGDGRDGQEAPDRGDGGWGVRRGWICNECHIKFPGKLNFLNVDFKSTCLFAWNLMSISNRHFAQTSECEQKCRFEIDILHRPLKKSI